MRNRSFRFDGSTYLAHTPSGISDGKTGTFFCVFRPETVTGTQTLIENSNAVDSGGGARFAIFLSGANMAFSMLDAAGASRVSWVPTDTLVAGTWYTLLASWNTDAGTDIIKAYLEDTAMSGTPTVSDAEIDYTRTAWHIGALGGTNFLTGSISLIFLDLANYIELDTAANRRKFYDANLRLASLGSNGSTPLGAQPDYFFQGPHMDSAGTVPNNFGSRGDMSVQAGTLLGDRGRFPDLASDSGPPPR